MVLCARNAMTFVIRNNLLQDKKREFFFVRKMIKYLTLATKVTNKLSSKISLKLAGRSETKSANRNFASNIKI
jgi:hypothetical protein